MSDWGYIPITVASSDSNAYGTYADFTCPLGRAINLPGKWEVALQQISSGVPTAIPRSFFVYLPDFLESTNVGSTVAPLLWRSEPVTGGTTYFHNQVSTLPGWKPVQASVLDRIRVVITDSFGQALSDFPVILSLVLRKIGD